MNHHSGHPGPARADGFVRSRGSSGGTQDLDAAALPVGLSGESRLPGAAAILKAVDPTRPAKATNTRFRCTEIFIPVASVFAIGKFRLA